MGVGDDSFSWAYDGARGLLWHGGGKREFGPRASWKPGDVIGCEIDLEAKQIRFFRNNEDMGVAFKDIVIGESVVPAVSLSHGSMMRLTFDEQSLAAGCRGGFPLQGDSRRVGRTDPSALLQAFTVERRARAIVRESAGHARGFAILMRGTFAFCSTLGSRLAASSNKLQLVVMPTKLVRFSAVNLSISRSSRTLRCQRWLSSRTIDRTIRR
jgi:hypothetical protein